jgi:hypothetical protein
MATDWLGEHLALIFGPPADPSRGRAHVDRGAGISFDPGAA